ncbi:MAG: hypothetical protein RI897_2987, partial [Verrucomicrobiota bacterium]
DPTGGGVRDLAAEGRRDEFGGESGLVCGWGVGIRQELDEADERRGSADEGTEFPAFLEAHGGFGVEEVQVGGFEREAEVDFDAAGGDLRGGGTVIGFFVDTDQVVVPALFMPLAHGFEVVVGAGEFGDGGEVPEVRAVEGDADRVAVAPEEGAEDAVA